VALRGYDPAELLVNAAGATDEDVLLSICLLREWWDTLPLVTICSSTTDLAFDASDVVVTRESVSDVLRALVVSQ
jgi:hypothetical protein